MSSRTAKVEEIWEAAKGALQVQVNKANYETWLKDTKGLNYEGNRFVVGTPSAFASEWLGKRLQSLVEKTLISIIGHQVEVTFQVCPRGEAYSHVAAPYGPVSEKGSFPLRLNPKYTFDSFVVGRCNRFAYATAIGVAEEPGRKYNPLFIHGGPGLGKTHLACAIGNAAIDNGFRVLYASTEQFTNEFINAIKEKRMEDFREKFRNVDILLLDDINFISGKPQTQEVLFHTFNELHNANRQVVITSDTPPRKLASLESRLGSRFEWGVIASIHFPDYETRLAILHAKAQQLSMPFDDEVFELLARKCKKTIRQLEGTLNHLCANSELLGKSPDQELAEKTLRELNGEGSAPKTLDSESLIIAVARQFNISPESIKSRKRDQRTTRARQISIYLLREKSNVSFQTIGDMLSGRDHSTVLHAYQNVASKLKVDPTFQKEVDNTWRELQSPGSP
ncbi:chromosomal replication initiator protein DnaA [Chloroflexota bacterium]